jgi:6-phosphofructokinase 1
VRDRVLASKLGAATAEALRDGKSGVMAGEVNGKVEFSRLESIWTGKKEVDMDLCRLAEMLAT